MIRCAYFRSRAFSLVELIVVLTIIGVAIALAMSAVHRARAITQRTACASNLSQIGKALHAHHDVHGSFPNNGGGPASPIPDVNGNRFIVTASFPSYLINGRYAVGDPALPLKNQAGSYAFSILPFVEQGNVFKNRAWYEGVRLYACPARRPADPQLPADDEFGTYNGGGWKWGKTDYAANVRVIWTNPYAPSMSMLTDGASQTILVGEKALSPQVALSGSWFYDQPFFLGNNDGVQRTGAAVLKDAEGISFVDNWGSAHNSGANFLFGDGSVRLLHYGIARKEMLELLNPSG
jgi:prepilin-type N-terminal cleavage/methylation domain-containing protein/prepilin-type processing-associated H-X9-DG protein